MSDVYTVPVDPAAILGRDPDLSQTAAPHLDAWADAYAEIIKEATGHDIAVQWVDGAGMGRRENYPEVLADALDDPAYVDKATKRLSLVAHGPYVMADGTVLTDADLDALASEAEHGYWCREPIGAGQVCGALGRPVVHPPTPDRTVLCNQHRLGWGRDLDAPR